jgi:hypothetical protein
MGVDGWRALRLLAVERDTTVNALAIEAFNDLLKKYGKRQSVENRTCLPYFRRRTQHGFGTRQEIYRARLLARHQQKTIPGRG